ncbi:ArsR/SmtB family transcription factor [Conexivisphaera calida]|nr:winged helix-turn-helix domain-containing protein [Conexivisphaera calida]
MEFDSTEHMFWWIFTGSRGGTMRARIVASLRDLPQNANQLAQNLGVNYRTITHHLRILEESGIVKSEGPRYGKIYFLTDLFQMNDDLFEEIVGRVKRR